MGIVQPIHPDQEAPSRHFLSVAQFLLLDKAGVVDEFAKAELIEGEIWTVNAIYRPHAGVAFEIAFRLRLALDRHQLGLRIYTPVSARLGDSSLSVPDIAVASPSTDDEFVDRADLRLVIEIAGSSLRQDLGRKALMYARAGIPEYWVVDLNGCRIHRHADAGETGYARIDIIPFGEPLSALTLAGIAIDTVDLA